MTLDQWLLEATGSFPVGVQKRLAQEYRAHLAESVAAGGSGDVVGLFGEAKLIEKRLKSLYITRKSWSYMTGSYPQYLLSWSNSIMAFIEIARANSGMWLAVYIVAIPLIWMTTRSLQQVRRANSRQYLYTGLLGLAYAVNIGAHDWLSLVLGGLGVLIVCVVGWGLPRLDARLRRTLELEQAA